VTAEEAAMIMMGGNAKPKLTAIGIYQNGEYKPPIGFDGFEKVTVNVPQETANIQPLSVTESGIYNASDYSCDGFDPVTVSVSDRYEEGYRQGYDDGYGKGYEDGQKNGKYTFPEGTEYSDIIEITADDTVVDTDVGYGIRVDITEADGRRNILLKLVDANGREIAGLVGGMNTLSSQDWRVEKIEIHTDGHYDVYMTYLDNGVRKPFDRFGYYSVSLKGFGTSGHRYTVSSN